MLCLVVDDDPNIRWFVCSVLQSEGFETLEAETGSAAFDTVQRLGGSVDLMITDINMPEGDGLTLASKVNAHFPAVRTILMSGYPGPECEFAFLAKPFSWAAVVDAVWRVLDPPLRAA